MGCCATLTAIAKDCESNIGGIKRAWAACKDEVTTVTVSSSDVITEISPANVWVELEFNKQTSSFTSTFNRDDTAGTRYWETDIALQFNRLSTPKNIAINELVESDIVLIVEDNNGTFWYFGYDYEVTVTDGTAETGTAFSDLNGYNITLNDVSRRLAYEVSEEAMTAIINGGEPTV